MVLWRYSIHEMSPFGSFLGPFSPKYGSILLKFRAEVVSYTLKEFFHQSFKILCLSRKRTYSKFTVLVHVWAQFTPEKCKPLPKAKFFAKTTFLGLWNKASPRSQKNHRIVTKLIKEIHFLRSQLDFVRSFDTIAVRIFS